MIINKSNLQAVYTGFKAAFNKVFGAVQPNYEKVATVVPSNTSEEKYGWLAALPGFREFVGERIIRNLKAHDYSIKNKTWELTFAVPREAFEDDQYGHFRLSAEQLAANARQHPDKLVFQLLAAGFATLCYDGQYFFDTDHPVAGASVSNMQAGAGAAWFLLDTSKPLRPLIFQQRRKPEFQSFTDASDEHVFKKNEFLFGADARHNAGYGLWQLAFGSKDTLDQANFEAAYAAMRKFKNDEGEPLDVQPTLLVVGPSNRSAALSVVGVQKLANGADNPNYKAVEILEVSWLD